MKTKNVHTMKGLTIYQRKILSELQYLTNELGGNLDGTSTNEQKYIDRQHGLLNVSKVIYGLFLDNPDNDTRDSDLLYIEDNLQVLRDLSEKQYPDRNGKF